MPAGRPPKYDLSVMEPIIIAMAGEGASLTEIADALDLHRDTIYDWIKPTSERYKPEFSDVIARAKQKSQAWWERQGRINLENKDFQCALFNKQIAGRFPDDWRDVSRNERQNLDENGKPTSANINVTFVNGRNTDS